MSVVCAQGGRLWALKRIERMAGVLGQKVRNRKRAATRVQFPGHITKRRGNRGRFDTTKLVAEAEIPLRALEGREP